MSRPTIVFCHGAWHSTLVFERVITILSKAGYKCVAVPMPSTGSVPPTTSLDADIAAVRSAVLKELEEACDVVVQVHSWGAIPVCSALDGLSKSERQKEGKTSAVTKLAFISALVVPEGVSMADFGGPERVKKWNVSDGNVLVDGIIEKFYHDIPPEEAQMWASKIRPQSLASLTDKSRSAAWRKIPSVYLVCEDDRTVSVVAQDAIIAKVKEGGGDIEMERLFVSHSPYLSNPEYVARFVRRAAGEDIKETS